ncbi:MAG TPA: TetR/AcrR family transcriptional regulator [Gaiellaceae bacterium]|nr:TetR/AcrR family transcriptional regulator [Gaiellaceae bacterium]
MSTQETQELEQRGPGQLWSGVEPATARRLLLAAVDSFAAVGYHASTTRDIAQRAGLSGAAVYAFYTSKVELLETISAVGHEAALAVFRSALLTTDAPTDRVADAVRVLATWHAENHQLARIVQQELAALRPDARQSINLLRREFETLLEAELERGVELGEFEIADLPGTTNALLSLCIDITRWYTPRSNYSPRDLGELYAALALRMIACPRR